MRQVKVFSGSSHPALAHAICERLGTEPAACELTKFSNGETSVSIGTSIRNQDIYIVQSGSRRINDSIMELLIMISACKGGSAKSITAVIPYFPYCRQSKKKSHRGAITARMIANLLSVAGMNHLITVDLHAPPMQGFFGKPVDNLHAEPLIARWIRHNVKNWQEAVVVSKNPGGSKRVTSLADVLKLNFGIITTDRRRHPLSTNTFLDSSTILHGLIGIDGTNDEKHNSNSSQSSVRSQEGGNLYMNRTIPPAFTSRHNGSSNGNQTPSSDPFPPARNASGPQTSPPNQSSTAEPESPIPIMRLQRSQTAPSPLRALRAIDAETDEQFTDERAREVTTGRLVRGHIVDDDYPSPMLSTMSGSVANLPEDQLGPAQFEEQRDPMTASIMSTGSSLQPDHAISGTYDQATLSDEEEEDKLKDPELEHTVTLVGDVHQKTVLIIDDIMDRSESWIAAAETVVKRGGATKVYCIATHGVFGENALAELEQCDCIDTIVVCDTFPIDPREASNAKKLVVLSMAGMLAEAIRRNQYGESISQIYQFYLD